MDLIRHAGLRIGRALRARVAGDSAPPASSSGIAGFVPEKRQLTVAELALVQWLVENGGQNTKGYSSQIAGLKVVGRCACGCPTVDFAVGPNFERITGGSEILADVVGNTPEGIAVGVILHARQEQIAELEVYSLTGTEQHFGLPTIKSLKPF
jgi:hypothetical protein